MADDDTPKIKKLVMSCEWFSDRVKNGDFVELLIRTVIFIVLVVITHWTLKTIFMQIIIRILKYYFKDPLMNLMLDRLRHLDLFGNYASDIGLVQNAIKNWL